MREQNPERYARLSAPLADADAAEKATLTFQAGIKALREELGLPDVVVAFAGSYMADGEPVAFVAGADWGDAMKAEGLAAWLYGRCASQREALVKQFHAQGGQVFAPEAPHAD